MFKFSYFLISVSFLFVYFVFSLSAENLSEAEEAVICSQNLNNFAQQKDLGKTSFGKKRKAKNIKKQLANLVDRFEKASCDVVALQEITGKNEQISKERLRLITNELFQRTSKKFDIYLGASNDRRIRNGYLVNQNVFKVKSTSSLKKDVLPKLFPTSPLTHYSRGPFVIHLESLSDTKAKDLILINVHFKSKASHYRDPSKTKYELRRAQMAEGLKRSVLSDISKKYSKTPIVILGDLNSDSVDAASQVLSGELGLNDFAQKTCTINEDEEAVCSKNAIKEPQILRLIHQNRQMTGNIKEYSSYKYSSEYKLIDEILLLKDFDYLVKLKDGSFNVGLEGSFSKGSDHKLLWAKLRLN